MRSLAGDNVALSEIGEIIADIFDWELVILTCHGF